MDINKALTFVFEDERWLVKVLIGTGLMLLSFLIIPIFFIQGYMIRIVRNVMDGVERPLPEWDNWGEMFKDGLNLVIAGLVWTLPIWLAMCCSFLFFIPAGMSEGSDLGDIMAGLGAVTMMAMLCLVFLFGIALMFIMPAITVRYAQTDELSSVFQFGNIIALTREHLGDIIIAVVVIFGLSLVLGLVGIVPIIGWIISLAASIYVTFVSGHLFGQIGEKMGGMGKEKGPDAIV